MDGDYNEIPDGKPSRGEVEGGGGGGGGEGIFHSSSVIDMEHATNAESIILLV